MGYERNTKWTCDVCGKEVAVTSGKDSDGTNMPRYWKWVKISILPVGYTTSPTEKYAAMCDDCWSNFINLNTTVPETRGEFKKPFWQRLFGGKK